MHRPPKKNSRNATRSSKRVAGIGPSESADVASKIDASDDKRQAHKSIPPPRCPAGRRSTRSTSILEQDTTPIPPDSNNKTKAAPNTKKNKSKITPAKTANKNAATKQTKAATKQTKLATCSIEFDATETDSLKKKEANASKKSKKSVNDHKRANMSEGAN